jgi:Stress responsive A/B Barrel Domain
MKRMFAFVSNPAPDLATVLAEHPGVVRAVCSSPPLAGSFPVGDHFIDVTAADSVAVGAAIADMAESVSVLSLTERVGELPEPALRHAVKRVLVVRVLGGTPASTVERFEHELARMPEFIPAIRNWALSRVEILAGDAVWTHAWEQEYRDRASFQEYMDSPYHWGVIEKWFDPTFPERIVDTRLAQVFYDVDTSLLSPAP